ncbi:MAG: polysaccharide biosynthesis protein [Rhizobiaceae bacterium]|nr:polysaccharide biosynthesis protein [Rhizobiaceae bacterium]
MKNFIINLSYRTKWVTLLLTDVIIVGIAFYLAFALRFGKAFPAAELDGYWPVMALFMVIGGAYAILLGLPSVKVHAFEIEAVQRIAACSVMLVVTAISLSFLFAFFSPRSIPIIFGVLFFVGSVSSRLLGLFFLNLLLNANITRTPVLIYGAGAAGIQLVAALRQSSEVKPIAFIDDNIRLQKSIFAGLSVYPPSSLDKLVRTKKIRRILVAIPSIEKARRREIIQSLDHLSIDVQVLPSYVELISGVDILAGLRSVAADELLGREKLDLIDPDLANSYHGKSIMITGAGGSIGSELCRQILKFLPSKLVLFEQSEIALYQIERELMPLIKRRGIEIKTVLGSVCDGETVAYELSKHDVQIIFHAAAYKHVPLVESNELAGLRNNVLGTHTMAEKAAEAGIERFVLISTDKAVRPTNVMGASKRLAEMIVQDADKRYSDTIFSMVRFGNVLGSSGSVIPLFREQIAMGGPITLTHEDVTRFFMAISEAAHLVLTSGSLATGGDIFVLDMGESIKIADLARRMVELSDLTVADEENPDGDIEIITTGLRPGEKLYEELLIGDETLPTPHPKILRAKEKGLTERQVAKALKKLHKSLKTNDVKAARALIEQCVEGYHKQL